MATRCKALFYISFSSLCSFWIAAVAPWASFTVRFSSHYQHTLWFMDIIATGAVSKHQMRGYMFSLILFSILLFDCPRITSLFWALHSTDFIHHYLWVLFSIIVFCGKFCQDGLCGYDIIFLILLLTLNMDLL